MKTRGFSSSQTANRGFTAGFTLIELLVVVAIIGLLASVLVLNTRSTRLQAYDSQIQSLLHQLRNAAEFSYGSGTETYDAVCDELDNTLGNTGAFGILETEIKRQNGNINVACFESGDKKIFAASSPLMSKPGKSWCVKSAGLSTELNCPAIDSSDCVCP